MTLRNLDKDSHDDRTGGHDRTRGRRGLSKIRLQYPLLILLTILQIADVLSTNHNLATPGTWELNPVMALSMAHLGAVWWLPKVGLVGYAIAATPFTHRRWPLVAVVGLYVAIVANNSLYL